MAGVEFEPPLTIKSLVELTGTKFELSAVVIVTLRVSAKYSSNVTVSPPLMFTVLSEAVGLSIVFSVKSLPLLVIAP